MVWIYATPTARARICFRAKIFFSAPRPIRGAEGTTPLEGEGNPAEGGYFVSIYKPDIYIHKARSFLALFPE